MMHKEILYGLAGIILGAAITGIVAVNTDRKNVNKDNAMTMTSMVDDLNGKSGDAFDEAFLASMIEHHQGAVDMANLAKQSAGHQEIKKMADNIISTQTKEIADMKSWQKAWGYTSSKSDADAMQGM